MIKKNNISSYIASVTKPHRRYIYAQMEGGYPMKLVIAEKPSVAQSIARVIGAAGRKDEYLEGNGYLVSWCVGHLVELSEPETYDERYSKWRLEDLPILPERFLYEVSPGTRKQYQILKGLIPCLEP